MLLLHSLQVQLFILLVGAHYCGDLISYAPKLSGSKRDENLIRRSKAVFIHCFFHMVWVWLWLWSFSIKAKLWAGLYILVVHFCIDFTRPFFEQKLIAKSDFIIFKKKSDVLLWLKGRADKRTKGFLDKYFYKWIFLNIADQLAHLTSIVLFVYFFSHVMS